MSDLIDREEALECFHCWIDKHGDVHEPDEMPEYQRIEALPSAQPMRKRGKWRRRLVDNGFNADWHCSECGWKTAIEEHGYNYCPNCGADMRGEQDERDS